MSKLSSVPRRNSPRLQAWVVCSIGIIWLLAMLVVGSSQALASPLTANSWSSVASMPTARANLAASLGLGGRIFAIGA